MNKRQYAIRLLASLSLIVGILLPQTVLAEDWPEQYIDSISFGGSIEGNSKSIYLGFTRYKQGGIGLGIEVAAYRYDQEVKDYDYSSTYTERDISLTMPIAASKNIYITPSLGIRQIKDTYDIKGNKTESSQYEPLYGLGFTYMFDNVSLTVGIDKSESSDWSITYGLGVSF